MKRLFSLLTMVTLGLQACDSDSEKSVEVGESVFGQTYLVNDAGDLDLSSGQIKGTGSLIFNQPLGGVDAQKNFALSFRLEDGGQLGLISHANSELAGGVSVLLKREGAALNVSLAAKDQESAAVPLNGVDASALIQLRFDVHNNEDPAHILIWQEGASGYGEAEALLNSEDGPETPAKGSGNYWGLSLTKASVEAASVGKALFSE